MARLPTSDSPDDVLLPDIRAFITLANSGSMTAAAETLHEHKANISRRLARLEQRLGVSLMVRAPDALTLTEEGAAYLESARHALSLLDETALSLRDRQAEPAGTVRLTAPVDISAHLLPPILQQFLAARPQVSVNLIASDDVMGFDANNIDIALRASRALADTSLVATRVFGYVGGLYASPGYLAARGRPTRPSQLAHHDLLHYAPQTSSELVLTNAGSVEKVGTHVRMRHSNMSVLFEFARAGVGIATLPDVLLQHAESRGLERILPSYQWSTGAIYMITRKNKLLPRKTQVLKEFLLEALRR